MTRTHQLEATLKALRLSGMLETFEARLAQARAGDLGHVEFLQALCEDEIERRQAAAIVKRVRAAHFEQACTLEDYDFSYNPKIPAAHIRDLATLRFVTAGESVILHGPVGVGKTMIAQALGHAACRSGYSAVFTKTSRLLADLAGGHADRTWEARLRAWARPHVLILDDFAMRDFSSVQADDLYELVTERSVNGHQEFPIGGHEHSPRTATRSPQGRPWKFPRDGHENSPWTATLWALGQSSRGFTPLPEVASARRTDSPSVTMTWAWWRSRSTRAEAIVLSINWSNPDGCRLEEMATERFS